MPEVPESVEIGLKSVRETLHLRWNPQAVRVRPGYIDASGIVKPAEWEPRWELWDIDADGRPYKIMTLQHQDGSFKPPGDWLVDLINFLNPARWDGDPNKMIAALVDEPMNRLEQVADEDSDDFFGAVASWHGWMALPKERVLADTKAGQWSAPQSAQTVQKPGAN